MLAFSQRRSKESQKMIESVRSREWGLLILDEVHVAPADMFRRCLNVAKSKCKLGLTATLLREDAKISDLSFLVGPKLFEADWLELQRQRYLATVRCVEIWCPLDPLFCRQYILQRSTNRRNLLQTMNPSKFRVCEHLIRLHEERGDKIMVFSDNIFSLKKYAVILGKPFIYGRTSEAERLATLKSLQEDDEMSTVFISKIGDCSIDLPDVNVVIQISSHFSSRRQEAQRLGRILRPKARSDASAHFYTLVSEDTDECVYAARRQRFLIDQGYMFEVKNGGGLEGGFFEDEKTKKGLLKEVMAVSEKLGSIESDIEDFEKTKTPKIKKGKKTKFKSEKMKKIKESILRRK
ncbi:TFIIH basal transcription factor complex helicase XPB subunit, partial [Bonamia ostreae]